MKLEIAVQGASDFDDYGFEEPYLRVALLNADGSKKSVSEKTSVGKKGRVGGVYAWEDGAGIVQLDLDEGSAGGELQLQFFVYCDTNGLTNQYDGIGTVHITPTTTPAGFAVQLLQEEGIDMGTLQITAALTDNDDSPQEITDQPTSNPLTNSSSHAHSEMFSHVPLERASSVGRYLQMSDDEEEADDAGELDEMFEDIGDLGRPFGASGRARTMKDAGNGIQLAATAPLPLRPPLPAKQLRSDEMGRARLSTMSEDMLDTAFDSTFPEPVALPTLPLEPLRALSATGGEPWIPDLSKEIQRLRNLKPKQIGVKIPSIVCSGSTVKAHQIGLVAVRTSLVPIATSTAEVAALSAEAMPEAQLLLFGDHVLNVSINELMLRSRYFKEGGCPRLRIELIVAARVQAFAEVYLPGVLGCSGCSEIPVQLTPTSQTAGTYTAFLCVEEHNDAAEESPGQRSIASTVLTVQIGRLSQRTAHSAAEFEHAIADSLDVSLLASGVKHTTDQAALQNSTTIQLISTCNVLDVLQLIVQASSDESPTVAHVPLDELLKGDVSKPLWLPLWRQDDRGSAPKPAQLLLEVTIAIADGATSCSSNLAIGRNGFDVLGSSNFTPDHPRTAPATSNRSSQAHIQPLLQHGSASERSIRGYADENRTNAGDLVVFLDQLFVFSQQGDDSAATRFDKASYGAELELLPDNRTDSFGAAAASLPTQMGEQILQSARWSRAVVLPIMYSDAQRKVASLRFAITRASTSHSSTYKSASNRTMQVGEAQIEISSFVLFGGRPHTLLLPVKCGPDEDHSDFFMLVSVWFVPSLRGTPSVRHPGLTRHGPSTEQVIENLKLGCEHLATSKQTKKVQLDLQILGVLLDPKAAGVLEFGEELSLDFRFRNSPPVRVDGAYPHRLADPNISLGLEIVGEESVLLGIALLLPVAAGKDQNVGECSLSVPFALATSGHMLEGNIPLQSRNGNRVATVKLTAQLRELGQMRPAEQSDGTPACEAACVRHVHIRLKSIRGLQERDLLSQQAFITSEYFRSHNVGSQPIAPRTTAQTSYHEAVAAANAAEKFRTRLMHFSQQQLAVMGHHELPIGVDMAPFEITEVPSFQHELTSPCWKITIALCDPCTQGETVVAEAAIVLSWRLVREHGTIDQVLVLRRLDEDGVEQDLRLAVQISVRPPQQRPVTELSSATGAVLLWMAGSFQYSHYEDQLAELDVCIKSPSQSDGQVESVADLMARAFAAPLQRAQLRRRPGLEWAGFQDGWVGSLSLTSMDNQLCLQGATTHGERVIGMVPFKQTVDTGAGDARWELPLLFSGDTSSRQALAVHLNARSSIMPFAVSTGFAAVLNQYGTPISHAMRERHEQEGWVVVSLSKLSSTSLKAGCLVRCSMGNLYWDQKVVLTATEPDTGLTNTRPRKGTNSSDENHNHRQQSRSLKASRSKTVLKSKHVKAEVVDGHACAPMNFAMYIDTSKLLEAQDCFVDAFTVHVEVFQQDEANRRVACVASARVFMAPLVEQALRQAASNQPPFATMKKAKLPIHGRGGQRDMQCHAEIAFCFARLAASVTTSSDDKRTASQQNGRQQSTVELAMKRLFYAIDTDGSGTISLQELAAAVQHRRLPRSNSSAVRLQTTDLDLLMGQLCVSQPDPLGDQTHSGVAPANVIQELFNKIDKDKSGTISWWEWLAFTEQVARVATSSVEDKIGDNSPSLIALAAHRATAQMTIQTLSPELKQLLKVALPYADEQKPIAKTYLKENLARVSRQEELAAAVARSLYAPQLQQSPPQWQPQPAEALRDSTHSMLSMVDAAAPTAASAPADQRMSSLRLMADFSNEEVAKPVNDPRRAEQEAKARREALERKIAEYEQNLAESRKRRELLWTASVMIQTWLRRYIRRWRARKQATAKQDIYSVMRTLLAVKRFNNVRRACTKVQKVLRGHQCRRRLSIEKQRAMDSELAEVREYASVLLQKAARGMLARQRVVHERSNAIALSHSRNTAAKRIQDFWRASTHESSSETLSEGGLAMNGVRVEHANEAAEEYIMDGHQGLKTGLDDNDDGVNAGGGGGDPDGDDEQSGALEEQGNFHRPPIGDAVGWVVRLIINNDGEDEYVHAVVLEVNEDIGTITVRCIDIDNPEGEEHDEEIPYEAAFIEWVSAPTASSATESDEEQDEAEKESGLNNDMPEPGEHSREAGLEQVAEHVGEETDQNSDAVEQQDFDNELFKDPDSSDEERSFESLEMAAMENVINSARRNTEIGDTVEHNGEAHGVPQQPTNHEVTDTSSELVRIASPQQSHDDDQSELSAEHDANEQSAATDHRSESDVFDLSESEASIT